jgi:transglutaminase-like putative cysteine protease
MRYAYPLSAALSPYSNALHVDESVKRFAMTIEAPGEQNVPVFLAALNQQIFSSFRHVTRPEGSAWPSNQTLSVLEGSCRDLAVLFCDVCRVMGIASRFVSGYECASAGQPDSEMHAWAEAYLPSAGWRGYDPSRGLLVADRHVAVAAAFHADLASPITGLFSGTCGSRMETRLHQSCRR